MRLFRPIIYIMGNFIGIILGFPIVILTLLFIADLNQNIKSTQASFIGFDYSQLLNDLIQDVQLHRAYSINYVNIQIQTENKLDEQQLNVMKIFENNIQYDREEGQSIGDKVSQIYRQWIEIESNFQQINIQQLFAVYNNYFVSITDLLEIITNEYELILAKEKFSYYLINDVIRTLPPMPEQLGLIRRTVISTEVKLMNESQQIIAYLYSAKRYLRELELHLTAPSFDGNMDKLSISIIQDIYKFVYYATKVIDAKFDLYDQETSTLLNSMSQQLNKMELYRILIYFLQIFAFILTLYCFFAAKRNNYISQQKVKQVKNMMSLKVIEAREDERKRLAMELHDNIGQSLYSILVKLNVADQLIAKGEKTNLLGIMEITEDAMKEIKRISQTLRPGVLDFFGFIPALKSSIEQYSKTYNIEVDFNFSGDKERLNPEIETHLFRICQEAFTNVAKHSSAKRVYITINVNEEEISLTIQDNGHGFSSENYVKNHHTNGIGLISMKERAESLNGSFEIESIENQGTTINVRIPRIKVIKGR